jgi:hypothetical protein
MGLTASKQQNTESLNWDKINTESMSTSIPNMNNISKDANQLISNLSINDQIDLENTDSDNENLFAWIKNIGDEKDSYKNQNVDKDDKLNTESFSETSAFISSDMYKYLMNKNSESATSNVQVGGGIQEDSSTSSTSSSPKKTKKNKKTNKKVVTTSSSMSGGNLSYISSSAHTESNNDTNVISSSADYEETSISVGNNQMLTSSINTSDINLVEPNSE